MGSAVIFAWGIGKGTLWFQPRLCHLREFIQPRKGVSMWFGPYFCAGMRHTAVVSAPARGFQLRWFQL